jgi:O-antigen ligase
MTSLALGYEEYARSRARLSIRSIKYFIVFLLTWQGNQVGGSLLQIGEFSSIYGIFSPDEFYLILLAIVLIVERSMTGDFTLRRSYFGGPIALILLGLFISWFRGVMVSQRFTFVYEAHEALILPLALPILLNAFRDEEDRWALYRILLLAPIWKAFDGLTVYFWSHADGKEWGVVQMWRDGYLLGLGVVAIILMLHFKPTGFDRLRKWIFVTAPVVGFTLLMSFRRTFIVGSVVSAFAMLITIGKGRRKKHGWILAGVFLSLIVMVFATDPVGILSRLSGIVDPSGEGSAYIRLLEYPNVLQNIAHNPIWGTPIGTQWIQYYRMPRSAVYTTLGCHNTYLYYPLRTGIIGTVAFFWLLARLWKSALLNYRLRRSVDDEFFGQLNIQMLIVYQVACMFGLMYGDTMSSLFALIIVAMQLHTEHISGGYSYADIALIPSLRSGKFVHNAGAIRYRVLDWLSAHKLARS